MHYTISICICTYNRYDHLDLAIQSVLRQKLRSGACEIIVVDNSPDGATAQAFASRYASERPIKYVVESSPGLSNARNVGVRLSSTPIIAFIDDDAIAEADWAQEILQAFDVVGPAAMVAGGRIEPIWGAPRPSWLHDSMLGSLSVVDWGGEARIAEPHEWMAGANIAFRVDAILSNGGFAQNLGRVGAGSALLSNEEMALIERIRASGGKLIYAPKARVRHLVDATRLTPSWFRRRAAWQAASDFIMAPERTANDAVRQWQSVVRYFNALPPLGRTVRGLAFETDDPELFQAQTSAIYVMSALLLNGFDGVDLD